MPDPVTPETARSISMTLVRVMRVISSMKSRMPLTHLVQVQGLDHSHLPTLFTLGREPSRVSMLAELIHSDISTVSRQVTHLVQIGLVEKIDDPQDGRAQLLSLSPTGRQVIDEIVQRRGEWFEQLLKGWDDTQASEFLAYLTRFGDDIESFKLDLASPATHVTTSTTSTIPSSTPELVPVSVAVGPSIHQNQEH